MDSINEVRLVGHIGDIKTAGMPIGYQMLYIRTEKKISNCIYDVYWHECVYCGDVQFDSGDKVDVIGELKEGKVIINLITKL